MTKNSNGMYSPIFSLKQQILTSIVAKSRGEEGVSKLKPSSGFQGIQSFAQALRIKIKALHFRLANSNSLEDKTVGEGETYLKDQSFGEKCKTERTITSEQYGGPTFNSQPACKCSGF